MDKTSHNNTTVDPGMIADKGDRIYQEQLKDLLEKDHKGEFVAIEVESGAYFLGKTPEEALEKARKEFLNRIFHLIRVGHAGVYKVGWSISNKTHGWIF